MSSYLKEAIANAGGAKALARALGITHQAVSQWDRVPVSRVQRVEQVSGVPKHLLRPDIYPGPHSFSGELQSTHFKTDAPLVPNKVSPEVVQAEELAP